MAFYDWATTGIPVIMRNVFPNGSTRPWIFKLGKLQIKTKAAYQIKTEDPRKLTGKKTWGRTLTPETSL